VGSETESAPAVDGDEYGAAGAMSGMGNLKCSEETYPNAALSTTNPT
jgi:hypothetical protein